MSSQSTHCLSTSSAGSCRASGPSTVLGPAPWGACHTQSPGLHLTCPALLSRAARLTHEGVRLRGRPRSGTTLSAALVLRARLRGDFWQDRRLWDLGCETHLLGWEAGEQLPWRQALTLEFHVTRVCDTQPLCGEGSTTGPLSLSPGP